MSDILVGTIMRGYEFRTLLGKGGNAVVYRAYHKLLDREVAIKFILPEYNQNPDFIKDFESEARLVAKLEHAHIVPIYDYWSDENNIAIVMRCFNGGSLRERLKQHQRFSPQEVGKIVEQVGGALAAAHRFGVVHRDLKPENILFDEQNNAFLADFGIAMPKGSPVTGDMISCTFEYAAPEQMQGFPATPQMDIYALGIIICELLTGVLPTKGESLTEVIHKQFHELLPIMTDLPEYCREPLNALVQRASAKNPDDRYKDILDLVIDFQRALTPDHQELDTRRGFAKMTAATSGLGIDSTTFDLGLAETPESIIVQHLQDLYQRLDSLNKRMDTPHGEATDHDLRSQVAKIQYEIDYRNQGLKNIEALATFNPPLALRPSGDLPPALIGVDSLLAELRQRILRGKSFALLGPSGIGKSELAATLSRDADLIEHFKGQIIWLQFGKQPDLLGLLGEWLQALSVSPEDLSQMTSVAERKKRLLLILQEQPVLVILDDVWNAEHVREAIYHAGSKFIYVLTTVSSEVANDFLTWEMIALEPMTLDNRLLLLESLAPSLTLRQSAADAEADTQSADTSIDTSSDTSSDTPLPADEPTVTDQVRELLERLGGFPRDIVLLSKRLRKATTGSRLQREIDKLLKQPSEILSQGYTSLALTAADLSDEAKGAWWRLALLPAEPNSLSEAACDALCDDLGDLDALLDFSLLRLSHIHGQDRYSLHPTFAEYAREHLRQYADDDAYQQLVAYYQGFAERYTSQFAQLAPESRNLEAALTLAAERGMNAALVKGTRALYDFWESRGMVAFADEMVQKARAAATNAVDQAALALAASKLASMRGDLEAAAQTIEQGLAVSAAQTQTALHLQLAIQHGQIKKLQEDFESAKQIWTDALSEAQATNDQKALGGLYNNLGTLEIQIFGNPDGARENFLKSVEAARKAQDLNRVSNALQNLGLLTTQVYGEYPTAKTYLDTSVQIARELDNAELISAALQAYGMYGMAQNQFDAAHAHLDEALHQARRSKSAEAIAFGAMSLANVEASRRKFNRAEHALSESLKYAQRLDHAMLVDFICQVLIKSGETRITQQNFQRDEGLWQHLTSAITTAIPDSERVTWLRDLVGRLGQAEAAPSAERKAFIAQSQLKLGILEGDLFGDSKQAAVHYQAALDVATEINHAELMAEARGRLSAVSSPL